MVEHESRKRTAYQEMITRSQIAGFYSFLSERYPSLAYVAELASLAARQDGEAVGLTEWECENAWRIGFYRGDQGAASVLGETEALKGLDTQEKELSEILEEGLNLRAAMVRY